MATDQRSLLMATADRRFFEHDSRCIPHTHTHPPHPTTTTATTAILVAILVSALFFGNSILGAQWGRWGNCHRFALAHGVMPKVVADSWLRASPRRRSHWRVGELVDADQCQQWPRRGSSWTRPQPLARQNEGGRCNLTSAAKSSLEEKKECADG